MIRFVKQNTWFPKAYRWLPLSEEMFFQTLAVHHHSSPTFAKWLAGHAHPQPINDQILSEAKEGWHHVARKKAASYGRGL